MKSEKEPGFTLAVKVCQNKTRFVVESRIPAKMTIFCACQFSLDEMPSLSYSIFQFETLLFLRCWTPKISPLSYQPQCLHMFIFLEQCSSHQSEMRRISVTDER